MGLRQGAPGQAEQAAALGVPETIEGRPSDEPQGPGAGPGRGTGYMVPPPSCWLCQGHLGWTRARRGTNRKGNEGTIKVGKNAFPSGMGVKRVGGWESRGVSQSEV